MRTLIVLLLFLFMSPLARAAGIGDLFAVLMGRSAVMTSENAVDEVLGKLSTQMNKGLPRTIDGETRLDKVSAVPGRHFIYHYTLISLGGDDVSPESFHNILKPQLKSRLCANREIRNFLKNGVTVSYLYKSKDGEPVGSAKFAPDECDLSQ